MAPYVSKLGIQLLPPHHLQPLSETLGCFLPQDLYLGPPKVYFVFANGLHPRLYMGRLLVIGGSFYTGAGKTAETACVSLWSGGLDADLSWSAELAKLYVEDRKSNGTIQEEFRHEREAGRQGSFPEEADHPGEGHCIRHCCWQWHI